MRIKKGDKVLVISGKDKGKTGKVSKALPSFGKIVIEGINIKKKHTRPKKEGEKGQVVQMPSPFNVSNVKLVCDKCSKATRVGFKVLAEGKKTRICKKCKAEL